jgi:hypothetical protein
MYAGISIEARDAKQRTYMLAPELGKYLCYQKVQDDATQRIIKSVSSVGPISGILYVFVPIPKLVVGTYNRQH